MSNVFLGQIIQGGWNFAPRGFSTCSGQLLAIQSNTALFSLLGTTYGGNGVTTFALPDLRGRGMIGPGQGPGLSNYDLGQVGGTETTTLTSGQMPAHTHTATFNGSTSTFSGAAVDATMKAPFAGSVLARSVDTAVPTNTPRIYAPSGTATTAALGGLNVAGTVTVNPAGSNQPLPILSPYLAVTIVIALQGIFPSRN
jgi:microcystin-dependent protein